MQKIFFIIFFISIFIMLYHLIFYGLLLKFLNLFIKEEKSPEIKSYPTITVLCPAYNEEKYIEKKIQSFLNLDYPKDKIEMIVISDNSTDRTNEIVKKYSKQYSNVDLIIQKPRRGKQSAHNMVEPLIKSDYVLSTDANSIFYKDSINELVKTIMSDVNIGLVSGELKLINKNGKESGEGIYWKYESLLKRLESKFYSIIGANGSIFLIKRNLFKQINQASVDDFERNLIVLRKGNIGKYNPKAIVCEEVSEKVSGEIKRKVRIISREWFVMLRNIELLNPIKFPKIFFMLFSHKLIRWLLPFFSLMILISNCFLISIILFKILLVFQILIYIIGIIEILLEKKNIQIILFKIPAYLVSMNYSASIALLNSFFGKHQVIWNPIRNREK